MSGIDIYELVSNFNFIELSLATALGVSTHSIIKNFTSDMVVPIIESLLGIRNFNDYVVKIGKSSLKLGSFIGQFINYILLILTIIIIILIIYEPIMSKVIERRNKLDRINIEHNKKNVVQNEILIKKLDKIQDMVFPSNSLVK